MQNRPSACRTSNHPVLAHFYTTTRAQTTQQPLRKPAPLRSCPVHDVAALALLAGALARAAADPYLRGPAASNNDANEAVGRRRLEFIYWWSEKALGRPRRRGDEPRVWRGRPARRRSWAASRRWTRRRRAGPPTRRARPGTGARALAPGSLQGARGDDPRVPRRAEKTKRDEILKCSCGRSPRPSRTRPKNSIGPWPLHDRRRQALQSRRRSSSGGGPASRA